MALLRKRNYKNYLSQNSRIPKTTLHRFHKSFPVSTDNDMSVFHEAESCLDEEMQSANSGNETTDMIDKSSMESKEPGEKETFLNFPLNSLSTISRFEALLMIIHYSIRHGLSNKAIVDLIDLINKITGSVILSPSIFLIRKIFSSDSTYTVHFYCKKCMTYIGVKPKSEFEDQICDVCGETCFSKRLNDGHFFMSMPIAPQIIQIVEEPGMADILFPQSNAEEKNCLSDIKDGTGFSMFHKKGFYSDGDLSITFNTDGSPVFKSVKNTLWPIQFHLNELPLKERFSSHRNLVAGLWFGSKEPVMETYLTPFLKEALTLFKQGLTWFNGREFVTCRVLLSMGVVDSVAKATLQCIKQFNGKYGCPYCYHPGEMIDNSQLRYTVNNMYEERTNVLMRSDMKQAYETGNIINGIKGISPFTILPYFDVVYGFPIDYMHCCLLGVIKLMASIWATSSNHNEDFYLSQKKMKTIDSRLLAISPPQIISRRPRPFSDMVHWKANEWRSWLLYYCVPCTMDILPRKYVKHVAILSSAIYILSQEEIEKSAVDETNLMLQEFVFQFQELYGAIHMNFNVHLVSHVPKCVSVWGPLWVFSAFPFETGNGFLVKLVKGTRGVPQQIALKYCMFSSIPKCVEKHSVSDEVLEFCDNLVSFKRLQKAAKLSSSTALGTFKLLIPNEEEMQALVDANMQFEKIWLVKKVIINSIMYAVKDKKNKKCNDAILKLKDDSYCEARHFIKINDTDLYAIVVELLLDNITVFENSPKILKHIKCCKLYCYGKHKVIHERVISCKSIFMNLGRNIFITDFPNMLEKD